MTAAQLTRWLLGIVATLALAGGGYTLWDIRGGVNDNQHAIVAIRQEQIKTNIGIEFLSSETLTEEDQQYLRDLQEASSLHGSHGSLHKFSLGEILVLPLTPATEQLLAKMLSKSKKLPKSLLEAVERDGLSNASVRKLAMYDHEARPLKASPNKKVQKLTFQPGTVYWLANDSSTDPAVIHLSGPRHKIIPWWRLKKLPLDLLIPPKSTVLLKLYKAGDYKLIAKEIMLRGPK